SVRVTTWILNHAPTVTPNQVTSVSALLGMGAAALLIVPRGLLPPLAAFFVYQLHILADYVDGELARVKNLASIRGAYYDLMVGRRSIPAFLVYQIIAALAITAGFRTVSFFSAYDATPRSLILILFAVSYPTLALSRSIFIARTGHIPRRQDLVRDG